MAEKNKKTITGQVLNSIKINKLKCINGLNEIIFKPHALTAILGPNGSGKSTILHAALLQIVGGDKLIIPFC
ncbi:AAA family ATPase [Escherichia coli]